MEAVYLTNEEKLCFTFEELLEEFDVHMLSEYCYNKQGQIVLCLDPTERIRFSCMDEYFILMPKKEVLSSPPMFEFKFYKNLKSKRQEIVNPLIEDLKTILGVTTKEKVYVRLASDFGVSKDYVKKIFYGVEPLKSEYILLMEEKYQGLNLGKIFGASVSKKLNANVLTDLQTIMNSKDDVTANEIRSALLKFKNKINNKTNKEIETICEAMIDLLDP